MYLTNYLTYLHKTQIISIHTSYSCPDFTSQLLFISSSPLSLPSPHFSPLLSFPFFLPFFRFLLWNFFEGGGGINLLNPADPLFLAGDCDGHGHEEQKGEVGRNPSAGDIGKKERHGDGEGWRGGTRRGNGEGERGGRGEGNMRKRKEMEMDRDMERNGEGKGHGKGHEYST